MARNARAGWSALTTVVLGACGGPATRQAPLSSSPSPGELETAPAWIYRSLSTGMIVQHHKVTTYTLRRYGDRALLAIAKQTADQRRDGSLGGIGKWSAAQTTSFTGRVETQGSAIRITVDRDGERIELQCTPGKLSVAGATAVRRPSAGSSEECGDRGQWAPAATRQLEVLRCNPLADSELDPDRTHEFMFAAAPGIEFLYVNDDCRIQGGGYRAIAADGAIAPVRPPE